MKKILVFLLALLLPVVLLTACNDRDTERTLSGGTTEAGSENAAQSYMRLTQWDYHPSYNFLLESVEDQGDSLLLRGVIARNTLTPEEVEVVRAEGTIEINGEVFTHTAVDMEGFMPRDRLYNAYTGAEIFLVMAFFGEFEGDDIRYRMYEPDGQRIIHKKTGMYREVEVDKTTPVEIWRRVAEPREWGYNVFFEPVEASARVFYDYTEYYIPDGFPFDGTLFFSFENGRCIHVRWNS